ncbi:MAG: hypothetical protein N3F07_04280, partial [Candidatus Micrarchaeota archaeon]|nr:hypothetical protein [Candidatus Micrarchaeota archaeon]
MPFGKSWSFIKPKHDSEDKAMQYEQKISSFKYEVSVESNFARRLRLAATRAIISHIVNRTN